MAFEKYEAPDATGVTSYIAFHSNAQLRLSRQFIKDYKINQFSYVFLYYDGETDCMAIEPLKIFKKGSLKINNNNHNISVKGFIQANALEVEGRYYKISKKDNLIIIDLEGVTND